MAEIDQKQIPLSTEEIETIIKVVLLENSHELQKASEDLGTFARSLIERITAKKISLCRQITPPEAAELGRPKIEKGVPMPGWRNHKYPWETMEIGDSFWAPVAFRTLQNAAEAHAKYHKNGRRYMCRPEGKGTRIWRVEPPRG